MSLDRCSIVRLALLATLATPARAAFAAISAMVGTSDIARNGRFYSSLASIGADMPLETGSHAELIAVSADWDRAMTENDADAIGRHMADDWTIVGSDGSVGDKATFLALVRSGALSHDVMTTEDMHVRVYGDTAVTVSRGVSGGRYQGQPFREIERVSCIFVRQEGRWRCVLTHLSRLSAETAPPQR